jgi:peptidoglycan-N-acetylglucosamine deacetylase
MFSFRNTTILFFILFMIPVAMVITGIPVPLAVFILLPVIYISVSFGASFFIRSGYYMDAVCRVRTDKKVICLTFDDGPHSELTPLILDILKNKAKATFFCTGKKIGPNENIIRRMDAEGHLIGTHSYSHSFWFDFFPAGRMKKEFAESEEVVAKILNKRPLFFRPPYGVINPPVRSAVRPFNWHVTGFSNRSLDSKLKDDA